MSTYTKYKIYLTPNQKEKVQSAFKSNKDCTLRIQPKTPNTELMLTTSQINNILKAKRENKAVDIKLSKTQLEKSGGFLQFLAPFVPTIIKGALTGVAGYVGSKAAQKVVGKGVKKSKGKGIYVPGKKVGSGIFLPGKPKKN